MMIPSTFAASCDGGADAAWVRLSLARFIFILIEKVASVSWRGSDRAPLL
jgi:hypothetical protein